MPQKSTTQRKIPHNPSRQMVKASYNSQQITSLVKQLYGNEAERNIAERALSLMAEFSHNKQGSSEKAHARRGLATLLANHPDALSILATLMPAAKDAGLIIEACADEVMNCIREEGKVKDRRARTGSVSIRALAAMINAKTVTL